MPTKVSETYKLWTIDARALGPALFGSLKTTIGIGYEVEKQNGLKSVVRGDFRPNKVEVINGRTLIYGHLARKDLSHIYKLVDGVPVFTSPEERRQFPIGYEKIVEIAAVVATWHTDPEKRSLKIDY